MSEVLAKFGMNLASAEEKGGGGSDGLKTSKTAWTTAGKAVGTLATNVRTAKKKLTEEQKGVGAKDPSGASGVKSAVAQRDVCDSWKLYLNGVAGRCAALETKLKLAGTTLAGSDEDAASAFYNLDKNYRDTPAVGGKGKG
ncbi:hypothetical protein [Streptomyces sp. XD-27]|uniref:hypothetical protein n=1 Tax=Streptomyces sp. XD-27 TaxID=3062779 RepID=UPI0026F4292B|nr:hypothetical protein [Streptomyces sp. XD-27]WKX72404.1 hypothetical protein Q3Y56_23100 [Streptomyces sp. XD-27]